MSAAVAVVGAGPAGATAAAVLAASGVPVDLIDRWAFPRDKVCGDALTDDSWVQLGRLGARAAATGARRLVGARVHVNGLLEPAMHEHDERVRMLPRRALDHGLVHHAVGAGARLVTAHVTGAMPLKHGVRLFCSDGANSLPSAYAAVVAADGAGSRLARITGLHPGYGELSAYSMRLYVDRHEGWDVEMDLVPGPALGLTAGPGFGWILPLSDRTANEGVYVCGARNSRGVPRALTSMLEQLGSSVAPVRGLAGRARGGWVRYDYAPDRVRSGAILVAGDAAGLAGATSGEGISFALRSGEVAARTVIDHLAGSGELRDYEERLDAAVGDAVARERTWVGEGRSIADPTGAFLRSHEQEPRIVCLRSDQPSPRTALEDELTMQLSDRHFDLKVVSDFAPEPGARAWLEDARGVVRMVIHNAEIESVERLLDSLDELTTQSPTAEP